MSAQGGVRAARGAHGVTHVESAPVLELVNAWLDIHPEDERGAALAGLSAALGLKDDTLRRRLSRQRGERLISFDLADRLLTATDQTHEWQDTLAGLIPEAPTLSKRVRLPGETGRLKKHFVNAKLSREQLDAIHRLHVAGMSIREIVRQGWKAWGYASEHSALNSALDMLHSYGYKLRDRIEATQLASTTHGLAPRVGRGDAYLAMRRQRRRRGGEVRGVMCAGTRTNYPRKGGNCCNPAGRESAYCWAHDPERETERVEIVARARQSIRGRAVA